jgi:hypothetical protein
MHFLLCEHQHTLTPSEGQMLVNSDTVTPCSELFILILVKAGQVFMELMSLNKSCNMKHILCPVHFSRKCYSKVR